MNAASQNNNRIITISASIEQQEQPLMTKRRSAVIPSDSNDEVARMKQRRTVQRRMKLFLLVRILLQYLNRVDPAMLDTAKKVLKDCERKHIAKDSKYATLADAIEDRLRDAVGETHWTAACWIHRNMEFDQRHRRNMIGVAKERNAS